MPNKKIPPPHCPQCGDDTVMRIAKGDHWEVVCLCCLTIFVQLMPVDEPTDDPDLFTTFPE